MLPPLAGRVRRDGHKAIAVAGRLGILRLPRQVLSRRESGTHVMPGDAALPSHHGTNVTRGLHAWACLPAQDLPFASAARLLGRLAHEEQILSPTTLRVLVRRT